MTEHGDMDRNADLPSSDRRAAHERLSTGALARWARACATHPWRVVFSWLGILAALIVLVATVGGSLRDEFEIPGSDAQKATDLIESRVRVRAGRRAEHRLRGPEGERLDTPERKAAIEDAIARLKSRSSSRPPARPGSRASAIRSSKQTFSDDGRIAYAEAQFDQTIEDKDRDAVVAVEDSVRDDRRSRPASPSSTTAKPSSRRSSRAPPSRSACSPRSSCC